MEETGLCLYNVNALLHQIGVIIVLKLDPAQDGDDLQNLPVAVVEPLHQGEHHLRLRDRSEDQEVEQVGSVDEPEEEGFYKKISRSELD